MKKVIKKKEKSVKPVVTPVNTTVEVCEKKCISKLEGDFGRADLNQMRDKINEIIENGN